MQQRSAWAKAQQSFQAGLVEDTAWYINADGGLNVVKLISAFQTFFREHSEHWLTRFEYREAGPQLLLQAFLQRIVNSLPAAARLRESARGQAGKAGGGRIEREYGLGRRRTDLLIVWPQGERTHKFVVECKLLHKSLEQTADYMDRCAAEAGHLIIFDRREDRRWNDKIFHLRQTSDSGVEIDIWGM